MTAEKLMLVGGIAAFLLTVYWVRSRDLREKYAVIWIVVASVLLLSGLFPGAVKATAERLHLSYPTLVLFVSLGVIYVYSFAVSVSLSHQHRRNVRLMQELAILEARIRKLEHEAQRPTA